MYNQAVRGTVQEPIRIHEIRLGACLSFWLISTAFLLGVFTFWTQQSRLGPVFLIPSYLALLIVGLRSLHIWKDPFNPLCSALAIGLCQLCIPALLLLNDVEPPHEIALFYDSLGLSGSDWLWGHALALLALLAVALGWMLVPEHTIKDSRLKFHLADGTKYAALAGMSVGALALLAFILGNAGLGVIMSGEFRGTTIQVGTGKYFFLAYLLLAGSLVLSCYKLNTAHNKWISLLPVSVATALYWPLGGRGRALTSLLGGLLFLWYANRERTNWKKVSWKPITILRAVAGMVLVVWFMYAGSMYRGSGGGVRALAESLSLSGFRSYVASAAFTDLGQLHSLAGAVAIGPGVLAGETFLGALTWPLGKVLPIPGRSAGIYIVETLAGFHGDEKWGVHATLIGDAYLNFGLVGVCIVMLLFGSLLKMLYMNFRGGNLHITIYIAAFVHTQQILLGSIEVWPYALTVLGFTVAILLLGRTVFSIKPNHGSQFAVRH
jgi:hypothetical protein